jgi:hypothetical protein
MVYFGPALMEVHAVRMELVFVKWDMMVGCVKHV